MEKILIVSSNEAGTLSLIELLRSNGFENVATAVSAAEARRTGMNGAFDLVLINMPVNDETGKELAFDFVDHSTATVIAIVKVGHDGIIGSFGRKKGVFVITKPLNRKVFIDSVIFALGARRMNMKLIQKNAELTRALNELKVVSKAKCILIANEAFSEEEAHHYIEQNAMNRRLTKVQVGEKIIAEAGIPGDWRSEND